MEKDEELLSGLSAGNQVAFTTIYRKYWPELYNVAYKRVKNRELSQDIVQNVFTSLWDRRQHAKIRNLPAYLHTSVKFQVLKQSIHHAGSPVLLEELENIITSPFNTDDPIRYKEITELVQAWINILPEKRREIFLLHYREELSTLQIAEVLKVSRKTVQNQLNTATQTLKLRVVQSLSILIFLYFILR
ncbi:sigma-70 family RNA polymerase sigma factor [Pedobacter sp. BS3]|uniref:RNA polymerase sigma factor n=1 Tax=Pedobacter sp. BS3 TaxID=2567937 RepID=UPI0011EC70E3|nr:sigma-70 family RNA polymerase sigma factor [Pedobacter sp. BS3]TZF81110.1 sigma-70 family RNA polymerase sigma factor [Pedobacter sp. BS3]